MLTDKQKDILKIICLYMSANSMSPTVRNICELVGLKSSSTVHKYLNDLEKEGYITKMESIPRSITITEKGKAIM